ncbi:MAG: LOG family protein [Mariprofundaceae bacterium]
MNLRPRLAAFGSSRTPATDQEYARVALLARRLAEAGWDGMTGGHQGMMAAFSEGIRAGGGHVRGITLARFPTPPDNTLSEEIRARDFFDRMRRLIEEADAWLVLPGGLGTLAELAMSWDLLAIRVLEHRPLVLFGAMWPDVVAVLRRQLQLSTDDAFDRITLCRSVDEAVAALTPAAPVPGR